MLEIMPLPALIDNYIWTMVADNDLIVVDPSESQPVLDFIARRNLNLTAVLLTHNHRDHTDGVAKIRNRFPDVTVYGPAETAKFATVVVEPEQHLSLFGYDVRIIESAGHTAGHISYLFGNEHLFCGDSLFSGGCGRVLTGDYQAQFDTLQRFKALPEFIEIYPAHEYTQSNLKFAKTVLPPSCEFSEYEEWVDMLQENLLPTLPTSLERELQINPFLQAVDLEQFIALRRQKDEF